MFSQEQLQILNSELDSSRVKTREKGNINLSYLEGFDIIETANTVFGFGNWDYAISKLELVSSEINQNQNNAVCYKAVVQVLVHNENHSKDVSREDVGFGTGVAKGLSDAHEGAAKEAVTDALKRALRSFGNQFGNSLYSKDKNHSNNGNYQNQQNQTRQSTNNYQQHQSQNQSMQNGTPYRNQQDFSQLTNLGLSVMQQGNILVIVGENQFEHKTAIRNSGFFWSPEKKQWYMQLRQAA